MMEMTEFTRSVTTSASIWLSLKPSDMASGFQSGVPHVEEARTTWVTQDRNFHKDRCIPRWQIPGYTVKLTENLEWVDKHTRTRPQLVELGKFGGANLFYTGTLVLFSLSWLRNKTDYWGSPQGHIISGSCQLQGHPLFDSSTRAMSYDYLLRPSHRSAES